MIIHRNMGRIYPHLLDRMCFYTHLNLIMGLKIYLESLLMKYYRGGHLYNHTFLLEP